MGRKLYKLIPLTIITWAIYYLYLSTPVFYSVVMKLNNMKYNLSFPFYWFSMYSPSPLYITTTIQSTQFHILQVVLWETTSLGTKSISVSVVWGNFIVLIEFPIGKTKSKFLWMFFLPHFSVWIIILTSMHIVHDEVKVFPLQEKYSFISHWSYMSLSLSDSKNMYIVYTDSKIPNTSSAKRNVI